MVTPDHILTSKEENILLQVLDVVLFELRRPLIQLFLLCSLDNNLKLEESCTSAAISFLEV
jgi:hypothetical protein